MSKSLCFILKYAPSSKAVKGSESTDYRKNVTYLFRIHTYSNISLANAKFKFPFLTGEQKKLI